MLYLPQMQKSTKNKIAIFFTIFFMAIVAAPSLIMSIDESIDMTCFYGENEEEEKEGFKLLYEFTSQHDEDSVVNNSNSTIIGYTFKNYPKPHLNLILPPPEFIS
jgi:hypothetical protein